MELLTARAIGFMSQYTAGLVGFGMDLHQYIIMLAVMAGAPTSFHT